MSILIRTLLKDIELRVTFLAADAAVPGTVRVPFTGSIERASVLQTGLFVKFLV